MSELLEELRGTNQIMRFEVDGRSFGAIRNFRVYQRPKSPTAQYPITPEVEKYVGINATEEALPKRGPGRPRKTPDAEKTDTSDKSIPQKGEINSGDGNLIPRKMENNSQMERREGDNNNNSISPETAREAERDDGGGEQSDDPPKPAKEKSERYDRAQLPTDGGPGDALRRALEAAGMARAPDDWRAHFDAWAKIPGIDFDRDVLPTIRRVSDEMRTRGRGPFRFKAFDQAIRDKVAEDEAEVERGKAALRESQWREEQARKLREEEEAEEERWQREERPAVVAAIAAREASGPPQEGATLQ
ncbi:MAG: hypothetical protein V4530_06160 [Pseudomonadota bacterium]